MLPTHRLFHIIQLLRGTKRPVKAQQLAEELQVSVRTVYRDIAELQNQHVPIVGEAGIGYILKPGYDMPPLMLTPNEVEAALLGAHWVAQRGEPTLAKGARDLIAKIREVVPQSLQALIENATLVAPTMTEVMPDQVDVSIVRDAVRQQQVMIIHYSDQQGRDSRRRIWPFLIAYFDSTKVIAAWCELRNDFRHFRTDRISAVEATKEYYPKSAEQLKAEWWQLEQQRSSQSGTEVIFDK